jgi:hypothetical protein
MTAVAVTLVMVEKIITIIAIVIVIVVILTVVVLCRLLPRLLPALHRLTQIKVSLDDMSKLIFES